AEIIGIDDRGALREGMRADLVIFDPQNVQAKATYPDPLQLAEGFDVVLVNGRIARQHGQLSSERFGRVLSPGSR
ncbi:MAG TPA: hypothetical protein VF389_05200, partial [Woeseiaceae bacterium]